MQESDLMTMGSSARKSILTQKQRKTTPQDNYESTLGTTKNSAEKFSCNPQYFQKRGAFFNPIIQGTGEPACRTVPSTTPRKYQLKQERVTWKSFSFIKGKSILLATRT